MSQANRRGGSETSQGEQRMEHEDVWDRPLTDDEAATVAAAREKAYLLYEGRVTPHRSCGIALAETFGLATPAYQSLRKGGITGLGACGSIVAGRLLLGELFGDPDPTGAVTPELRSAIEDYEAGWPERIDRGRAPGSDIVCNTLTGQFASFTSPERAHFCTTLASEVAALCAEIAVRRGLRLHIEPLAV